MQNKINDCPLDNAVGGDAGLYSLTAPQSVTDLLAMNKPANDLRVPDSQSRAFLEHEFALADAHKASDFMFASSDDFDDKIRVATPHSLAKFDDEWLGIRQPFMRGPTNLDLKRAQLKRHIRNSKILRALMILFIGVMYALLILERV